MVAVLLSLAADGGTLSKYVVAGCFIFADGTTTLKGEDELIWEGRVGSRGAVLMEGIVEVRIFFRPTEGFELAKLGCVEQAG